ncbi:DNZ54_00345 family protein [Enterobacter kobei]|uniref:DNZ54_00345 family protein n=1 Tax=Enterobacter cloacae complex TaxID=354276 RepID=UPI001255C60A|nr:MULTISPECIES: DNZ54_00345 family protein [Enterobacter cloacae complex]MCM7643430.1 DNZ54_00345 family protein [Enterobacter hormaechei]HBK4725013.1 lysA protein [Enterobacter hormaechei subsp. steigerwaltii]MCW4941867.1 DNZ54_00345 family protein [Enterobacter hormaechei subsp. xiangfangensis]VAX71205.1 LysA protein [Enterobacter kobei]HBK4820318.1 lysA protein [Enterobacter hormaechei subsp. steigerwaltii]
MKKYLRPLMFNALLALVLLWGLVSPQSAAVNFVAAWALFGSVVCITASLAGAVAYEHWLRNTGKSIPVNTALMKVFRAVFCRKPSQARLAWSLIILSATTSCLLGAGWLFTALIYLICVLTLTVVRTSYRQRIEEAGLCPESL